MADKQYLLQRMKRLADEGRFVEAGWISLRLAAIDPNTPRIRLQEMRAVFMAGAHHVFACLMGDVARMPSIKKELQEFAEDVVAHAAEADAHDEENDEC